MEGAAAVCMIEPSTASLMEESRVLTEGLEEAEALDLTAAETAML